MPILQSLQTLTNLAISSYSLPITIAIVASVAAYFLIPMLINGYCRNWKNAPPGPVGWPILGSVLDLSEHLHEEFFALAKVFGPLFSLKLGLKSAIVVSSPEMAHEVLKLKEASFSDRTLSEAIRVATYGASSIIFCEYGPRWKLLRKILITELLATKPFQQFSTLREKQVNGVLKHLYSLSTSNTQVNIAELAFTALANLMSNILCSKNLFDTSKKEGREMKQAFWEMLEVVGQPNIADLIPIFKPFDPQGMKRKVVNVFKRLDRFYDEILEERLKERENKGVSFNSPKSMKKDLLDVLLDYKDNNDDSESQLIGRSVVKAMISEMFVAGTETTSSTVEWGMTEILRTPSVYNKIITELDQVVGMNRFMDEDDIPNLPYLQAAVKEIFRLHPGVPLIIPRSTTEACEVAGYQIPKDCIVYVNIWGMARDPKVWKDPLEFKPERFIGSNIDVKGQDFNLLPFGSGRRHCVGWPLAHRMVHFYVASMLHAFEWDCPSHVLNNMDERFGLTIQKDKSLIGTPKPRLPIAVYKQ